MRNEEKLRKAIWEFVKAREKDFPVDLKTKKRDIKEATFEIAGEVRVSGEVGNTFSDMYVNYYEHHEIASELQDYLWKQGLELEWYNPAYMSL